MKSSSLFRVRLSIVSVVVVDVVDAAADGDVVADYVVVDVVVLTIN